MTIVLENMLYLPSYWKAKVTTGKPMSFIHDQNVVHRKGPFAIRLIYSDFKMRKRHRFPLESPGACKIFAGTFLSTYLQAERAVFPIRSGNKELKPHKTPIKYNTLIINTKHLGVL